MDHELDICDQLQADLYKLEAKDMGFAQSLMTSVRTRGFATEKQLHWLNVMLAKTRGEDGKTREAVGDLAGVYALFETAKTHLKHPAIVLGYTRGGRPCELKINVAGPRASVPGALNVKDVATDTWFGRVMPDGTFEHSRRDPPPTNVGIVLRDFSAAPARVAGEHGHLTGKCCFCNRALSDENSTAVGYGKTCAEHFGLPWGAKATKAAQAALPIPVVTAPVDRDYAAYVLSSDELERLGIGPSVNLDAAAEESVMGASLRDVADDWMEMVWEHEQGGL